MPDNDHFIFKTEEGDIGVRLDSFLTSKIQELNLNFSRSMLQKIIKQSNVKIGNTTCTNSSRILRRNEAIEVFIKEENETKSLIKPKKIDFKIVFEDEDLVVINKPAGLTTHPGAGNYDNTLVNGLIHKFDNKLSSISGAERPGIVHRLDKDTSGLMIVAKNDQSHYLLSKMIQDKQIERKYLAIIYGIMKPEHGEINKNIKRNRVNRLKMMTTKSQQNSRHAITRYKAIETFNESLASLIECTLLTGRTHQIRVHLESEKHSIIGDQTYNSCQKQLFENKSNDYIFIKNFPRQALHSFYLDFNHPITKKHLTFECQLPEDMTKLYKCLKNL